MRETYNYLKQLLLPGCCIVIMFYKMCAKKPVIKFSPFEALFIGEKNRILKRQPMKNTIFVTRLNQRSKIVNLRDLFGLEKSTKAEDNDVTFKKPQRVCDFLKTRRLQNRTKSSKSENGEILCYEFEGCKIMTKNNKTLKPKGKNMKIKPNKVKFKKKFKYKDIKDKVVKKFPDPSRKTNYEVECKTLALKCTKKNYENRHLLRGKDGKFISKLEYKKLKLKEISPRQKYLSNYLHQLYLKKNKQLFSVAQLSTEDSSGLEMPLSVEAIVGLPNLQFDIAAPETLLNEVSQKYYENNCQEDFQFPKIKKKLEVVDFEEDSNLIDIVYEGFPKIHKFECQSQVSDFTDALLNSDILKPEKHLKMYEKKKNGFIKAKEFREILSRRFSLINLRRINDIMPDHRPVRDEAKMYAPKIDEPYTKSSHLISGRSFGSFFFRSAEGKDIFIGNLMKPFLQNSWFGSLPES